MAWWWWFAPKGDQDVTKNDARTKTQKTFQDPNRKSPSSIVGAFLVERVVRGAILEVKYVAFSSNELLKLEP